jgi:uncharacterized protein YegL
MRSKLVAAALFAATAATVALFPHVRDTVAANPPSAPLPPVAVPDPVEGPRARVEVVFVLDTTGSMGGLIQAAKDKIWSIASTMASANEAPEVRMGLVAYRDRGDAYVTKVVDLSADLDSMYATLMDLRAQGGGDGPESVNQALHDAVHRISWSQDEGTYRAVFLLGDAPPHMDYPDDVKYPQTLRVAAQRGIVVNAIQCGKMADTLRPWQHIAQLGHGSYFQVAQGGGAVAITSPFDERLAALSRRLDETRLYYGNAQEKAAKRARVEAARKLQEKASVASLARRAAFNASAPGEANLIGEKELVDDVASGRVALESLPAAALPEPLKDMAPEAQAAKVKEMAETRSALRQEINALSAKRDAYLKKEVTARGGARDSLDQGVFGALREQAAKAGLSYDEDALRY